MENKFKQVSANPENPKWNNMISRENELYKRENDMRSEFERDYTRIIHSSAYRRLKHKTQVFFSPTSDHVCTRIEHVNHVESISYTIAKYLGLNTELTKAIATAHDLGHSPFGHEGERILSQICKRDIGENFWHEKNGLNFVDNIEVLEDNNKSKQSIICLAPFISKECLSSLVDEYIKGNYQEVQIDHLYPFMDSQDVKRVFKYIISKKEEN